MSRSKEPEEQIDSFVSVASSERTFRMVKSIETRCVSLIFEHPESSLLCFPLKAGRVGESGGKKGGKK